MSLYGIDIIMTRIKAAEPGSPIAVFECGKRECLSAVFADTVESRKHIKNKKDGIEENGGIQRSDSGFLE